MWINAVGALLRTRHMFTAPYEKQHLCNFDILERLAAAWNPPDISGTVHIVEGLRPHTLHICFTGLSEGREITIFGTAIDEALFSDPSHRKALARAVRDYFAWALEVPSEVGARTVI